MKYSIRVLYKDYHNKEVVLLGCIPTNLKLSPDECRMKARGIYGRMVTDPNSIIAFQQKGENDDGYNPDFN